jgi:hypothetical protein
VAWHRRGENKNLMAKTAAYPLNQLAAAAAAPGSENNGAQRKTGVAA